MKGIEALRAIQEAFRRGRYYLAPHSKKRMGQRGIDLHDIRHAILGAARAEPYADPERALPPGITSWRVHGVDREDEELVVGVDLVLDHLGAHATVITVF